jgi:hypothetical protein
MLSHEVFAYHLYANGKNNGPPIYFIEIPYLVWLKLHSNIFCYCVTLNYSFLEDFFRSRS